MTDFGFYLVMTNPKVGYAACAQVESLVVIAPRGVDLPRTIGGKRVTMLGLERLWGISLP